MKGSRQGRSAGSWGSSDHRAQPAVIQNLHRKFGQITVFLGFKGTQESTPCNTAENSLLAVEGITDVKVN